MRTPAPQYVELHPVAFPATNKLVKVGDIGNKSVLLANRRPTVVPSNNVAVLFFVTRYTVIHTDVVLLYVAKVTALPTDPAKVRYLVGYALCCKTIWFADAPQTASCKTRQREFVLEYAVNVTVLPSDDDKNLVESQVVCTLT